MFGGLSGERGKALPDLPGIGWIDMNEIIEDVINGAGWVLLTLVILLLLIGLIRYQLSRNRGEPLLKYFPEYEGPIVLDATGPHRRDKERIIEAGMIVEDRRHGRNLGDDVTLILDEIPADYSARLNLKSVGGKIKYSCKSSVSTNSTKK